MNRLWPALLPELAHIAGHERAEALRQARRESLDAIELAGMAAGLVLVTALTKFALPDPAQASRATRVLIDFAVATPMLVAVLGPLHLRRVRRGLRAWLRRTARR